MLTDTEKRLAASATLLRLPDGRVAWGYRGELYDVQIGHDCHCACRATRRALEAYVRRVESALGLYLEAGTLRGILRHDLGALRDEARELNGRGRAVR